MLHHFSRATNNITYVGNTTAAPADTNTLTIAYPSGTQDGDLAILFIGAVTNFGFDFTSTGWTSVVRNTDGTGIRTQFLYRTVSGTGNQTFTKSGGTTDNPMYILAVFRGATYSTYQYSTATTTAPNPPALTGMSRLVVCFGGTSAGDAAVTAPTDYTLINNTTNGCSIMGAYRINNVIAPDPGSFTDVTTGTCHNYTIGCL